MKNLTFTKYLKSRIIKKLIYILGLIYKMEKKPIVRLEMDFSKMSFLGKGTQTKEPKKEVVKNVIEDSELYLSLKKFYELFNQLSKDHEKEFAKFCYEREKEAGVVITQVKEINEKLAEYTSKLTGIKYPCLLDNNFQDFLNNIDLGAAYEKKVDAKKSRSTNWIKKEGKLLDHLQLLTSNYTNKEILHGILSIHLTINDAVDGRSITITKDMNNYMGDAINADSKIVGDTISRVKANSLVDYYILDSAQQTKEHIELIENEDYHETLKIEMQIVNQTLDYYKWRKTNN